MKVISAPYKVKESTAIRILWKGDSERLGCRLVIGISDDIVKLDDIMQIAVTMYATEDTEGKLLESVVIDMKAGDIIDTIGEGTFVSTLEDACLAVEIHKQKQEGEDICHH